MYTYLDCFPYLTSFITCLIRRLRSSSLNEDSISVSSSICSESFEVVSTILLTKSCSISEVPILSMESRFLLDRASNYTTEFEILGHRNSG